MAHDSIASNECAAQAMSKNFKFQNPTSRGTSNLEFQKSILEFNSMSLPNLIFTYVVALLGALAATGIYTELRRRRFEHEPSDDRIFRCRKCGYVYTDDPDVDRSRCSQCGQMNDAIEF